MHASPGGLGAAGAVKGRSGAEAGRKEGEDAPDGDLRMRLAGARRPRRIRSGRPTAPGPGEWRRHSPPTVMRTSSASPVADWARMVWVPGTRPQRAAGTSRPSTNQRTGPVRPDARSERVA